MDPLDLKKKLLEKMKADLASGHGTSLKQKYAGETPGERVDRKRTEYAEETGDDFNNPSMTVPEGLAGDGTPPGMIRDPNDDGGDPFTAKNPDGSLRMMVPTYTPERQAQMKAQNEKLRQAPSAAAAPKEEESVLQQLAKLMGLGG